jgi:hypothetical protein
MLRSKPFSPQARLRVHSPEGRKLILNHNSKLKIHHSKFAVSAPVSTKNFFLQNKAKLTQLGQYRQFPTPSFIPKITSKQCKSVLIRVKKLSVKSAQSASMILKVFSLASGVRCLVSELIRVNLCHRYSLLNHNTFFKKRSQFYAFTTPKIAVYPKNEPNSKPNEPNFLASQLTIFALLMFKFFEDLLRKICQFFELFVDGFGAGDYLGEDEKENNRSGSAYGYKSDGPQNVLDIFKHNSVANSQYSVASIQKTQFTEKKTRNSNLQNKYFSYPSTKLRANIFNA